MDLVAQRQASTAAQLNGRVQLHLDRPRARQDRVQESRVLPFVQSHDSRPLVLKDGLVRVHADKKFSAQTTSLEHGTGMAVVGKVEASIDPDAVVADRDVLLRVDRPLTRSWNALRDGQRL